jgi:serine/threonine protein kinase
MDLVIPWKVRILIAKQIAEGMLYLHNHCKIIHRDLKSLKYFYY